MKKFIPSQPARSLASALMLAVFLVTLGSGHGRLRAQERKDAKLQQASSPAAEAAIQFLGDLEKANMDAALGLWDGRLINDKLKARIDKMASKVKKVGGIKRIDVGECETRRIRKFEQTTGKKIDVVPMEIICGDETLILAVFSFRNESGGYRIFQLESLKEWGGTASLDDELAYTH